MSRSVRKLLLAAGLVLAGAAFHAAPAEAIPAFARKYQFSCTTCHAPFPRLKAFGEEFAANGFRLAEAAREPTRATHDVGDPLLRLAREVPLAFRVDGYASWKEDEPAESDLEWPWVFKILSGGPIHERISYYFYFLVEEGEVVGLEDAYLQFNDVLGLPVTLMAGQFQVCDPLFKRELRMTRADYDILKVRVGNAPVNLTYDRGFVAAWTAPGDVELVGQFVNGNGIPAAVDENFDGDRHKSGALRAARRFGPLRLGAFGYWGRSREAGGTHSNRTLYVGPDVVLEPDPRVVISAEYLERRDDDPLFEGHDDGDWETRGGFLEVLVLPEGDDGRWALIGLYNKVDSDDPGARRESVAAAVNRLLARNVRLSGEVAYDIERERTRISLGLTSAF